MNTGTSLAKNPSTSLELAADISSAVSTKNPKALVATAHCYKIISARGRIFFGKIQWFREVLQFR